MINSFRVLRVKAECIMIQIKTTVEKNKQKKPYLVLVI